MSEIDWSDVGMSELPTGTVTLLLADVESSTQLWETEPDAMVAAIARLDQSVSDAVTAHDGVRPVEQGEGDSFVIAFARASDAVACAVELQRAPLAPIKLRIGIHTGEVRLRDEGNYVGPAINRTARLRDLGHGGQTVLSATTSELVVDQLPAEAWLTDLGSHVLRGLPRPERVVQLSHPDLRNDFPPLRTEGPSRTHNLPPQLTSFIGRQAEIASLREALAAARLVTLTGAGGVGKTRLAIHVAAELAGGFRDGVCYVDLAPITHPDVVTVTAARALRLPDQPGRSTMDTLLRFIGERQMLIVLDNCEHLLDASARLVTEMLSAAAGITVIATSREPLGVTGEATWQVPSLALADDAIALFTDRARLARAGFSVSDDHVIAEICARLDGMPLAIELAAARVRSLSLTEILDGLHDRFRLLTGGSRTAVRRQQTLRASVEWSHALLTEPERVLFRRLAVFLGGFDLEAAQTVASTGDMERHQVMDQLTLLVEKSLVVAENTGGRMRYRLLETVRQYALEKLGESGEGDEIRYRHRDYYTAMAGLLDAPGRTDYEQRIEQVETEIDNLQGAFGWSLENSDKGRALELASSLQPLWHSRGRILEGYAWFDAALTDGADPPGVEAATLARALADKAVLATFVGYSVAPAQRALDVARELDDPALLARVLMACGIVAGYLYDADAATTYYAEAVGLARAIDDQWRLSQILAQQSNTAVMQGDPAAAQATAEEGYALAVAVGDRFGTRQCRLSLGWALLMRGDLLDAVTYFDAAVADCQAAHDDFLAASGLMGLGVAHAARGEVKAAAAAGEVAQQSVSGLGEYFLGLGYVASAQAALAGGDVAAAQVASEAAWRYLKVAQPNLAVAQRGFNAIEAARAQGDLTNARLWADEAVAVATGWHRVAALLARARLADTQGQRDQAERDAHDALACAASSGVHLHLPDILDVLAGLSVDVENLRAARLYGAAESRRRRTGQVRFKVHQAECEASITKLRDAMGQKDFDAAWTEGAALSTEEVISYAQRGRGEHRRASSGWESLTPAELDVVGLVTEGLGNKDIAARLFVSPRTVQAHLTHVYTKLGISSRFQLIQEAAAHAD
ncbi:LuxR C-terminal-related transcriptional regulator [Mycobacterium sp. TY814]|uniref:helix-turn-helix transcriptional regulator n=2 Tax=unclassified Mycobacterium TaxID=2642494 RepID=UPI0035326F92